ncbi:hypothetical protein EV426DRAFT_639519 [Tirmania nivea]|nr:hypothetical protein EV426DRAFT_639519 [Tirmania nivea]
MPGVPPQALDMLKKFGRSLFKSKSRKQKKTEEQPRASTEPEAESSGPPAPYGVPPPPPPPPAPIVSETAPQIEAPKTGTHILLQRDDSTGFANFSIDIPEAPAAPVESAPNEETAQPGAPAAQVTTPEPAPAPEAPKVEEAPKLPEPVAEAPKAEDAPVPAPVTASTATAHSG